jgi:hypothetical protein
LTELSQLFVKKPDIPQIIAKTGFPIPKEKAASMA